MFSSCIRAVLKAASLPLLLITFLVPGLVVSQPLVTVEYDESDEIFPNPERGFYTFTEYRPGGAALTVNQLVAAREEHNRSLVKRNYTLSEFRDSDISESWLDVMSRDFGTMREAGVKGVIRFRYSKAIGEPDAPIHIIKRHLEQVGPILRENYDVISSMDAGFIGAWGEWHNSTNNLDNADSMRVVLLEILDVLPEERMVAVRSPRYKMQIYGTTDGLSREEAFDQSNFARTGHHNDGFLGSSSDLGTYRNPSVERPFMEQDTRFVPMGGETGGVSSGEFFRCDYALEEMERMHWTYLNSGWYGPTLDTWRTEGCMPEVERRLGYRFVLTRGRFSEEVRPGATLRFEVDLVNRGWASPFNPRRVQVVLTSLSDPDDVFEVALPVDPRHWLGGEEQSLSFDIGIPEDLPEDFYEIHLSLPDPVEELSDRPHYAIRLANEDVWHEETGYNNLNHLLVVDASADGEDYEGDLWFAAQGTSTSIDDRSHFPDAPRLHQNYPNPFSRTTGIRYDVPEPSFVEIAVFDIRGRNVASVVEAHHGPGSYEVYYDADGLAGGVYMVRLTAGEVSDSRRMIIVP